MSEAESPCPQKQIQQAIYWSSRPENRSTFKRQSCLTLIKQHNSFNPHQSYLTRMCAHKGFLRNEGALLKFLKSLIFCFRICVLCSQIQMITLVSTELTATKIQLVTHWNYQSVRVHPLKQDCFNFKRIKRNKWIHLSNFPWSMAESLAPLWTMVSTRDSDDTESHGSIISCVTHSLIRRQIHHLGKRHLAVMFSLFQRPLAQCLIDHFLSGDWSVEVKVYPHLQPPPHTLSTAPAVSGSIFPHRIYFFS